MEIINSLLNRNKEKKPSHISTDDEDITDPTQIANHFNSYFINATNDSINPPSNLSMNHNDYLGARRNSCIEFPPVIENKIITALKQLKNSSPGDDGIPMSLIKAIISVIMHVILHLINCSLRSGIFPEKLKVAKVLPLFKSGDLNNVGNFRPVSNLQAISKLYEKVVYNRITNFLDNHQIISSCQFGFKEILPHMMQF